jgi:hypothetical protein
MSDLIDEANHRAEIARLAAISNIPRPSNIRSTKCLNCQEPLKKRYNFCDLDCRSDYELRRKTNPTRFPFDAE